MKRLSLILMIMICVSASAQKPIRIYSTYAESYAATQLQEFLEKAGCKTTFGGKNPGHTIHVGLTQQELKKFKPIVDSLHTDGYAIVGDGRDVWLFGKGEKGTLYAVYAFLEKLGFRLYTPNAMVIPDLSKNFQFSIFNFQFIENPAFEWREVSYYYPNHSQLYADWHHLHTQADCNSRWGMYVHTFQRLIPPSRFFDSHPEWFSLNNGRRSRDGQLCLSNPEVLEMLCSQLDSMKAANPKKQIWSVSPNDNYNACECDNCRRLDSLYGGKSGTLLWLVNQVARHFPNKTIATLAYQYTRKAPTINIKPESNVLIMLCPIEAGREQPIATSPKEAAFRKDMVDWSHLTDNLFVWDYVVQFRNFWNPFPNLHVLQPNLQYFRDNGVRMMFEQATGADNITSWMDIRCYMIAKLLWNPDADIDSIMADFYQGYYGGAGRYVKEIIDTMTAALISSSQTLDIYGYPIDGADGYLSVERFHQYDSLMKLAWQHAPEHYVGCFQAPDSALWFFGMAMDFARNDLAVGHDLKGYFNLDSLPTDSVSLQGVIDRLEIFTHSSAAFNVPQMMEMGISPNEYVSNWTDNISKRFGENRARGKKVSFSRPATVPYNSASLTDGEAGIMDYRHKWLGFWGDTMDAVIDLEGPTEIHEVSLDFYFFPLSWIFLPQRIELLISDDGKQWQLLGEEHPVNPEILATPNIHTYTHSCEKAISAKYLQVIAYPLPEIPSWHRAAGQKPWIFTDEIIVK